jgi:hypothetical protein
VNVAWAVTRDRLERDPRRDWSTLFMNAPDDLDTRLERIEAAIAALALAMERDEAA